MNEDTFEQDKKIIESDILKAFTDLLNSEICNRKQEETIFSQVNERLIKYRDWVEGKTLLVIKKRIKYKIL